MKSYLKREELAELYRVSPDTISAWVKRGLPCVRLSNRTIRFDPNAVTAWLSEREKVSADGGAR